MLDCLFVQAAVDKYDEVMQTLEFARELQKQFQGISVDVSTYISTSLEQVLGTR